MLTPIERVRKAANIEEIDYNLLMGCLHAYKAPRDVITRMLRLGQLIRVKKGIYVFGKDYAKRPYSMEILANMLYGPSYISCEYALSFYGLIPEFVREITCMTTGRNKFFETPVGRFSYLHLSLDKYRVGIERISVIDNLFANIATPEKALADILYKHREKSTNITELKRILDEDLRIDSSSLRKLRVGLLDDIAKVYKHPAINLLAIIVRGLKGHE